MITMYDSIEISQMPTNAQAVAGYTSGHWPTFKELVKFFPKAHRLSIAVSSSHDADCLDIEQGDASIGDAPAWFKRQKAKRPVLYTSLSNVNTLVAEMERHGIHRHQYRLWSAHYTYRAHICGPSEGIVTYADATQYTDKAFSRNLDASLCSDAFFGPSPTPSNFFPADEARWEREYDALKDKKGPWPALRRRVLVRTMVHREREIVAEAFKSGWQLNNRHARYTSLFTRTKRR